MNQVETMTQSESIKALCEALTKAQAEMPVVAFDEENPFLHNQFASLGAVIAAVRPILAKHSLALMQFACSNEAGKVGVRTRLLHASGEWMEDTIYLPVSEEKGKSQAQVAGSIITYLRRYSQSSMLNLYADKDTDGGAEAPKTPFGTSKSAPISTPPKSPKAAPTAIGAAGGAKGQASPAPDPEKKALACKARFLQVVAEKKWSFFAWLYGVRQGWILDTERLEDGSPSKFPVTIEQFEIAEKAIKELMDRAAANDGPLQEEQEAYDSAHLDEPKYEPSDNDGGPDEDESWKDIPVPAWSKHVKEDGCETFGDLDKKQLWWWCVKWQPTGYKGKPPKKEDVELRRILDNVRSQENFTE